MMRRMVGRTKADARVVHEMLLNNDLYYPIGIGAAIFGAVVVVGGVVLGIIAAVNAK